VESQQTVQSIASPNTRTTSTDTNYQNKTNPTSQNVGIQAQQLSNGPQNSSPTIHITSNDHLFTPPTSDPIPNHYAESQQPNLSLINHTTLSEQPLILSTNDLIFDQNTQVFSIEHYDNKYFPNITPKHQDQTIHGEPISRLLLPTQLDSTFKTLMAYSYNGIQADGTPIFST
jgi:hypothetical protein